MKEHSREHILCQSLVQQLHRRELQSLGPCGFDNTEDSENCGEQDSDDTRRLCKRAGNLIQQIVQLTDGLSSSHHEKEASVENEPSYEQAEKQVPPQSCYARTHTRTHMHIHAQSFTCTSCYCFYITL